MGEGMGGCQHAHERECDRGDGQRPSGAPHRFSLRCVVGELRYNATGGAATGRGTRQRQEPRQGEATGARRGRRALVRSGGTTAARGDPADRGAGAAQGGGDREPADERERHRPPAAFAEDTVEALRMAAGEHPLEQLLARVEDEQRGADQEREPQEAAPAGRIARPAAPRLTLPRPVPPGARQAGEEEPDDDRHRHRDRRRQRAQVLVPLLLQLLAARTAEGEHEAQLVHREDGRGHQRGGPEARRHQLIQRIRHSCHSKVC